MLSCCMTGQLQTAAALESYVVTSGKGFYSIIFAGTMYYATYLGGSSSGVVLGSFPDTGGCENAITAHFASL
jgi:hypothetical protein